jgi:hypothetical protein
MRHITKPTVTRTGHWHYVGSTDARAVGAECRPLEDHVLKTVVGINIEDLWLEVPIRDGSWIAAYRLLPQDGAPVIGEVRLFPNEQTRSVAGSWSGELLGTRAKVPPGGITHRLLRELRVGHHLSVMGQIFHNIRRQGAEEEFLTQHGITRPLVVPAVAGRRRGRKPFPDRFYAELARDYVTAIARGSERPAADVARKRGLRRPDRVRDMLHEARKRGLLTPTPVGRRQGGDLTDAARTLLAEAVPVNVPASTRDQAKATHRQPTRKRKTPR